LRSDLSSYFATPAQAILSRYYNYPYSPNLSCFYSYSFPAQVFSNSLWVGRGCAQCCGRLCKVPFLNGRFRKNNNPWYDQNPDILL